MNIITDPDIFIPSLFAVVALSLLCWLLNERDKRKKKERISQIEKLERVVPVNTEFFLTLIDDLHSETGYDQDKLISWYCEFSLASGNDFVQMQKWDMFETFVMKFLFYGNGEWRAKNGIDCLCQMFAKGIIQREDGLQLAESLPCLPEDLSEALGITRGQVVLLITDGRFKSVYAITTLAKYYKKTILKYQK